MAATSAAKKSSPAQMPIEGYDRLPIKEILPLLKALSNRDLKAVAAHEKAGKNRVTLLRGIRQIELAREAAPKGSGKTRLAVVEEAVVEDAVTAEAVTTDTPVEDVVTAETVVEVVKPVRSRKSSKPVEAVAQAVVVEPLVVESLDFEDETLDVERVEVDPLVFMADATDVAERVRAKAAPVKKSRSRPPVKAATWEEELRPQLPKRYQSSAFDDLDPPVIAMEDSEPALMPTPAAAPIPSRTAKATSHRPRITKRLESVALVMAAILAVLLGLAIGTVLARTGSSGASPAPTSVAIEAASVPTGG